MELTGPKSLKTEHEHLHGDLRSAIAKGGRTGEAARLVAARLHPHFLHEEEFAIPPLGLLAALSRDESAVSPEMARKAVTLTDRLAGELPHMIAEHREIVDALASLVAAAKEEGHPDVALFGEKLMLHAQTEEEVLYPAAIILGRYLKLKAAAG